MRPPGDNLLLLRGVVLLPTTIVIVPVAKIRCRALDDLLRPTNYTGKPRASVESRPPRPAGGMWVFFPSCNRCDPWTWICALLLLLSSALRRVQSPRMHVGVLRIHTVSIGTGNSALII
jgi:hypothetical protein